MRVKKEGTEDVRREARRERKRGWMRERERRKR